MTSFLRITDPYVINVSPVSSTISVSIPNNANSFRIVNRNPFDIRIKAASSLTDPVSGGQGTLILSGSVEVFSTISPSYISVISENSLITGVQAGSGTIEITYGTGE